MVTTIFHQKLINPCLPMLILRRPLHKQGPKDRGGFAPPARACASVRAYPSARGCEAAGKGGMDALLRLPPPKG